MTLLMEDPSQPVFRDFLGSGHKPESKHPEASATDSVRVSQSSGFMEQEDGEASVRGGSTFSAPSPSGAPAPNYSTMSDPGSDMWRHGKQGLPRHESSAECYRHEDSIRKREDSGTRNSMRENFHMSVEALEASRPMKISRFNERGELSRGQIDALPTTAGGGELCLSMQPPRPSQAGNQWGYSKRVDTSSRPVVNGGVPLPIRSGQVVAPPAAAERMFARNNNVAPTTMQPPPADEGSRTGLQGGIAALINSANNNNNVKLPLGRPPLENVSHDRTAASVERPKMLATHTQTNAGSDPLRPSNHKASTSATRQLTIFYGGQAHVFDDVAPEKADAIMALAGSNGRSWSTTYAHRSTRSEGSLIDAEKRRDKNSNSNSSDMQTVLQGLVRTTSQTGMMKYHQHQHHHQTHQTHQNHQISSSKLPADVAGGNRFGASNGRSAAAAAASAAGFYSMKEAGSNQHWS